MRFVNKLNSKYCMTVYLGQKPFCVALLSCRLEIFTVSLLETFPVENMSLLTSLTASTWKSEKNGDVLVVPTAVHTGLNIQPRQTSQL